MKLILSVDSSRRPKIFVWNHLGDPPASPFPLPTADAMAPNWPRRASGFGIWNLKIGTWKWMEFSVVRNFSTFFRLFFFGCQVLWLLPEAWAKNKGVKVEPSMDSMVGGSVQLLSHLFYALDPSDTGCSVYSLWDRQLRERQCYQSFGSCLNTATVQNIPLNLFQQFAFTKLKFCPIFTYQDFLQLPLSKPKAPVGMPSNAQMLSLSTKEPGTMLPKKGKYRPSLSWFLILCQTAGRNFAQNPLKNWGPTKSVRCYWQVWLSFFSVAKKIQAGIRKFFWKKLGNMWFVPSPLILGST